MEKRLLLSIIGALLFANNANAEGNTYLTLGYVSGGDNINQMKLISAKLGTEINQYLAFEGETGLGLAGPKNTPINDYYDNGINTIGLDVIVYAPLSDGFKLGASLGYFLANPVVYKRHRPHNKQYFEQFFVSSSTFGLRAEIPISQSIKLGAEFKKFNDYEDFKTFAISAIVRY